MMSSSAQREPGIPTRLPRCPHCGFAVEKVKIFGHVSYSCMSCKEIGPWRDRATIRNPAVPKLD
jgi:hypothetical protein